jgi:alpha-galactosidase
MTMPTARKTASSRKCGLFARMWLAASVCIGLSTSPGAQALENGLARTPPMGWNSWNLKVGPISAAEVRRITDAIVSSGMRDLGYQYVVVDDCWSENARDAQGSLVPTKALFPDGMKALADYVHEQGLKFGMYATPTTITCCRHPGSYNHERRDAQTFAAWGVDFLKYDWCGVQSGEQGKVNKVDLIQRYTTMRDELAATQRPILFSLCEKGQETLDQPPDTAAWSVSIGNMWRNTRDIGANWRSVMSNFDRQTGALDRQGPGGWNDPDMLQVGNPGLSDAENRAHFSLWAMIAAPLMAGNDPSNMSAATKATLTNAEVIAVDQDPLGKAGQRVAQVATTEVWAKALQDGSKAVLMLNRGTTPTAVTATWADVGISGPARVRDLWAHADQGTFAAQYSATVAGHDVLVLRVYPPAVAWTGGAAAYPSKASTAVNAGASRGDASVHPGAGSAGAPSANVGASAPGGTRSSESSRGGGCSTTGAKARPAASNLLWLALVVVQSVRRRSRCGKRFAKLPP